MKLSSIIILLLLVIGLPCLAQSDDNSLSTRVSYEITSTQYEQSVQKLDNYITKRNYQLNSKTASTRSQLFEFNVAKTDLGAIDSLMKSLGYINSKHMSASNETELKGEVKLELNYLRDKKKEYEQMLKRIDSVKSEKYYSHWLDIRDIDSKIFEAEKKLRQLENAESNIRVSVRITEEQTTPTESGVSFVNMPGVEYSYLKIENPKPNLSYSEYQGVMLKYLFTRGKSYFNLGAYKAMKPTGIRDSLAYDELFNFSFGQDFYTRHFGRGKNTFFNLYVSYNAGAVIASTPHNNSTLLYVSPSVGTELIKTKYILWDLKAAYFLPFTDNRFMRGLSVSSSFNFVF